MRLVDLDAVIDHLEAEWGYEGIREDLYSLPVVDAVPVVRCKGCKYRTENGNCGHPRHHGILPSAYPFDFCSYGERRDGVDNKEQRRWPDGNNSGD